jgi:hypothetical protein
VGVRGASAVRVNVGRVGNPSGVKVGEGATVVGLTGVISARRCGPAQDTSPAPSAARNPFWRNFLLVSFRLMATTSYNPGSWPLVISSQIGPSIKKAAQELGDEINVGQDETQQGYEQSVEKPQALTEAHGPIVGGLDAVV